MEFDNVIKFIDNGLINDLKETPTSSTIIEVDVDYIEEEQQNALIIMDGDIGQLISYELLDSDYDKYSLAYGKLMNYIFIYGRPKKIRLKNNFMGHIIGDFCRLLGIEIIIGNRLINIEEFLNK
ncbi:MAG: DUF6930 domain-containing protein [Clostridium sp.]